MSVWAVEAEALVRMLICDVLEDAGLDIREAQDAETALDLLQHQPAPTVLVTDINLGAGMDGLALAAELRRRVRGLPVVYVTGNPDRFVGRALDPDERLFAKPFYPPALAAAVKAFAEGGAPPSD